MSRRSGQSTALRLLIEGEGLKWKQLDTFRKAICEQNSGPTRCQSCGGEGVEIGFSHLATDQKQAFEDLEHTPRTGQSSSRFDILNSRDRRLKRLNIEQKKSILVDAPLTNERLPVGFRVGKFCATGGDDRTTLCKPT